MQTIITQRSYSRQETFAVKAWHDGPVRSASIDEIPILPDHDWMPVGSVEFCRAAMIHQGIRIPEPLDYPVCLQSFMPEKPILYDWWEAHDVMFKKLDQRQWCNWHVKPWQTKLDRNLWVPETRVWLMPEHQFVAEYRVYVCAGKILGLGRYDDGENNPAWSLETILQMIKTYQDSGFAPAGYGLDVGVSAVDGKTCLVEVNDGWALGLYKDDCHGSDYLRLLQARWTEIVKNDQ